MQTTRHVGIHIPSSTHMLTAKEPGPGGWFRHLVLAILRGKKVVDIDANCTVWGLLYAPMGVRCDAKDTAESNGFGRTSVPCQVRMAAATSHGLRECRTSSLTRIQLLRMPVATVAYTTLASYLCKGWNAMYCQLTEATRGQEQSGVADN